MNTFFQSASPNFRLGPGFWAEIPADIHHPLLHEYVDRAEEILRGHDLPVPDRDRLELIVRAAVEAGLLFYQASIHDVPQSELNRFFADFVLRAVAPESVGVDHAQ